MRSIVAGWPLIVVINSYAARLDNADIFATKLEFFGECFKYCCNTAWVSEDSLNWYLGHEPFVVDRLVDLVSRVRPSEIIFWA